MGISRLLGARGAFWAPKVVMGVAQQPGPPSSLYQDADLLVNQRTIHPDVIWIRA